MPRGKRRGAAARQASTTEADCGNQAEAPAPPVKGCLAPYPSATRTEARLPAPERLVRRGFDEGGLVYSITRAELTPGFRGPA